MLHGFGSACATPRVKRFPSAQPTHTSARFPCELALASETALPRGQVRQATGLATVGLAYPEGLEPSTSWSVAAS